MDDIEELRGLRYRGRDLGAEMQALRTSEAAWKKTAEERFQIIALLLQAAGGRVTVPGSIVRRASFIGHISETDSLTDFDGRTYAWRKGKMEPVDAPIIPFADEAQQAYWARVSELAAERNVQKKEKILAGLARAFGRPQPGDIAEVPDRPDLVDFRGIIFDYRDGLVLARTCPLCGVSYGDRYVITGLADLGQALEAEPAGHDDCPMAPPIEPAKLALQKLTEALQLLGFELAE